MYYDPQPPKLSKNIKKKIDDKRDEKINNRQLRNIKFFQNNSDKLHGAMLDYQSKLNDGYFTPDEKERRLYLFIINNLEY